eukprot:Nk52_evm49s96 gene=Nk52_evmTU49s96
MNKNAFEETLKEFYVLERQLASYSIWANHIIAPHGLKLKDLRTGLSDVVNFVALLQNLSGESVGFIKRTKSKRRQSTAHLVDDLKTCLQFMKVRKIRILNTTVQDLCEGKAEIVCRVAWGLLLEYVIRDSLSTFQRKHTGLARDAVRVIQTAYLYYKTHRKEYPTLNRTKYVGGPSVAPTTTSGGAGVGGGGNKRPLPQNDVTKVFQMEFKKAAFRLKYRNARKQQNQPAYWVSMLLDYVNSIIAFNCGANSKHILRSYADFSRGKSLCILINHYRPRTINLRILLEDKYHIVELALSVIEKLFNVPPMVEPSDLIEGPVDINIIAAFIGQFLSNAEAQKFELARIQREKELAKLRRKVSWQLTCINTKLLEYEQWKQKQEIIKFSMIEEAEYENGESTKGESANDVELDSQGIMSFEEVTASKASVIQLKEEIERIDKQIMKCAVGKLRPHMESHIKENAKVVASVKKYIRAQCLGKYRVVDIEEETTMSGVVKYENLNMSLTQGFGFYKLLKIENVNLLNGVMVHKKNTSSFYDHLPRSDRETARQILGLSTETRHLIDPFFYEDYDIYVKALSGNKTLHKGSQFAYQVWHHEFEEQCKEELFKAAKQGDLMGLVNDIPDDPEEEMQMFRMTNKSGETVLHVAARYGHCNILNFALVHEAEVDRLSKNGSNAVMIAVEAKWKSAAEMLMLEGANIGLENHDGRCAKDLKNSKDLVKWVNEFQAQIDSIEKLIIKREKNVDVLEAFLSTPESWIEKYKSSLEGDISRANRRNEKGNTLLHLAVQADYLDVVELLLRKGANPNSNNRIHCTPLFYCQSISVMSELLKYGADVDHLSKSNSCPMHYIVKLDNVELLKALLNNSATPTFRNTKGMTPLHIASAMGHTKTAEALLTFSKQNEINVREVKRKRRQSIAAHSQKQQEMVDNIATRLGSDARKSSLTVPGESSEQPNTSTKKPGQENKDEEETTSALTLAVANKHIDVLRLLLANGKSFSREELHTLPWKTIHSVNPITNQHEGDIALQILELIISMGANVNTHYDKGYTLLHAAVQKNWIAAVNLLIDRGAEVNIRDSMGNPPLYFAVIQKSPDLAKILLENNSDVNVENEYGLKPFDYIEEYEDWLETDMFSQGIKFRIKEASMRRERERRIFFSRKLVATRQSKRDISFSQLNLGNPYKELLREYSRLSNTKPRTAPAGHGGEGRFYAQDHFDSLIQTGVQKWLAISR